MRAIRLAAAVVAAAAFLAACGGAAERAAPAGEGGAPAGCRVTAVVDGDTVDVRDCPEEGRVRLLLVDTPEKQDCFGAEATLFVRDQLLGKRIRLERDSEDRDNYGRLLRYVWLDDALFNATLARAGYAKLLVYENRRYLPDVEAAAGEAQLAKRGLWGACGFGECPGPIRIVALDKRAETVVLEGNGPIGGWELVSERGAATQRLRFPEGTRVNGLLTVRSGIARFQSPGTDYWWTEATVWSNSEDDDALLYDAEHKLACEFDDGWVGG